MLKRKQLFILTTILLSGISVSAQNNSVTTGGEATGSNGTLSYTVGQIAYTSQQGSNGNVNQGVQQPFEIYTVGVIENELEVSLLVFPNPTQDQLTLIIEEPQKNFRVELSDLNGKIHYRQNNINQSSNIDMSTYSNGVYFLTIKSESNELKTFKVIKK